MKLNKDTKKTVKVGDILRYDCGDSYRVTAVFPAAHGRGLCFTIRDTKTNMPIYCIPSSNLYGAEIIPAI